MQNIPLIDIRDLTPVDLVVHHKDGALGLINASRNAFGLASRIASYAALPIGDAFSKRWLEKIHNPYYAEIAEYARMLKVPGVYALNLCYEWGCTSGVIRTGEGLTLLRVLDWPFPGLGKSMVVAKQSGPAGDFYNITWPGVAGCFNAVAPGRFSVSLNQAPMRRHSTGFLIDWLRNRLLMDKQIGLPPAHLLRRVFEHAKDYAEAKRMLTEAQVAIPVIYTLAGLGGDEACVIERLESEATIIEIAGKDRVIAANHFQSHLNGVGKGWQPRATCSRDRYLAMSRTTPQAATSRELDWFIAPIANRFSRLAYSANARLGSLSLLGTEGATPVTQLLRI